MWLETKQSASMRKLPLKIAAAALTALLVSGCSMAQVPGVGKSPADRVAIAQEVRDRELRLAAAARSSGQPETALGIYEKLLKSEPDNMLIHVGRAEALFELNAHQQSLSAFNKAMTFEAPTHAHTAVALTGRGRTLLALGQAEHAETDFMAALDFAPANPVAINGLAVANDMLGRHGKAQAFYQEALAHDPGNTRVQSNLGLSYALSARFDDAVAQLAPIASGRAKTTRARHNLALTFGLMGRGDQAEVLTRNDLDKAGVAGNGKFYNLMQTAVGSTEGDAFSTSAIAYMAAPPAPAGATPASAVQTIPAPSRAAPPNAAPETAASAIPAMAVPSPEAPAPTAYSPPPAQTSSLNDASGWAETPVPHYQEPMPEQISLTAAPAGLISMRPTVLPEPTAMPPLPSIRTDNALVTPPDLATLQELKANDPDYANVSIGAHRDEANGAIVFGPELNLLETTVGQN